jgi:hypothetical protein
MKAMMTANTAKITGNNTEETIYNEEVKIYKFKTEPNDIAFSGPSIATILLSKSYKEIIISKKNICILSEDLQLIVYPIL